MKPSLTQRERARNLLSSVKHFSCFSLAEFALFEMGAFIAGILGRIEVHNKKKQYIYIEPVLVFQHQVQEPHPPVKNMVQTGCLPLKNKKKIIEINIKKFVMYMPKINMYKMYIKL
jgi:hypothetical protein